jgi:hypothetical protein
MMHSIRRTLPIIYAVMLTAVGCNQQPPPGPPSSCEEGAIPPEGSLHYPFVDGGSWTYLHERLGDAPWSETIEMHVDDCLYRTETVGDPNGSERLRWLDRKGSVIHRVRKLDVIPGGTEIEVVYEPGFPRFDDALLELNPGESITHEYERTERVAGTEDTEPRVQRYTLEATGLDVDVPAGSFSDVVRVRRTREPDVESTSFWYAPGVGKIREEELATGHVESLTEYEVDP